MPELDPFAELQAVGDFLDGGLDGRDAHGCRRAGTGSLFSTASGKDIGAFAQIDVDHHSLRVYVADLQVNGFADPQSECVGGRPTRFIRRCKLLCAKAFWPII